MISVLRSLSSRGQRKRVDRAVIARTLDASREVQHRTLYVMHDQVSSLSRHNLHEVRAVFLHRTAHRQRSLSCTSDTEHHHHGLRTTAQQTTTDRRILSARSWRVQRRLGFAIDSILGGSMLYPEGVLACPRSSIGLYRQKRRRSCKARTPSSANAGSSPSQLGSWQHHEGGLAGTAAWI